MVRKSGDKHNKMLKLPFQSNLKPFRYELSFFSSHKKSQLYGNDTGVNHVKNVVLAFSSIAQNDTAYHKSRRWINNLCDPSFHPSLTSVVMPFNYEIQGHISSFGILEEVQKRNLM